jgi:hypothetical protein
LAAAIRKVRDLPHSGYLLPIYTLFVDAVDRGRLNSNGLCRQEDIAMQEILDWS